MKEHPILFSTPMVQAILEGRKTQTRRIVKPQPPSSKCKFIGARKFLALDKIGYYWSDGTHNNMQGFWPGIEKDLYCRYGQPGDLLWVRETTAFTVGESEPYDTISYKADNFHRDVNRPGFEFPEEEMCKSGWHDADLSKCVKWKPSIHMPKAAARIWLEITEVKVERLQHISDEDIIAEGISLVDDSPVLYENYLFNNKLAMWPGIGSLTKTYGFTNPFHSFRSLIEKINGPQTWNANPWVWVVKFKVLSTTGKPSFDSAQDDNNQ